MGFSFHTSATIGSSSGDWREILFINEGCTELSDMWRGSGGKEKKLSAISQGNAPIVLTG
jgi:hypothetical protein